MQRTPRHLGATSRQRFTLCRELFLSAALLVCVACQSSREHLSNQPTASTAVRFSPGDTIKVTFPGATELTQTQKINVDGKVNLPLIGEVAASGKTIPEFQKTLIGLYKSQLRNNEVVVTLESGTANVVVSGYVNKPGKLAFDRPTSVFQAIMEAGGISEYGNASRVQLVRTINGQQHTEMVDLKPSLHGRTTQALYVQDGDVIYVPQKLF